MFRKAPPHQTKLWGLGMGSCFVGHGKRGALTSSQTPQPGFSAERVIAKKRLIEDLLLGSYFWAEMHVPLSRP